MLDVQQKLPATEGHVSAQKMPRVEGEGVKDAVETSDYPKHVPHPIHGSVIAKSAEHEAEILGQIAALPPKPEPTADELEMLFLEKSVGRSFTDTEKAFVKEIMLAMDSPDDDDPEDDIIILPQFNTSLPVGTVFSPMTIQVPDVTISGQAPAVEPEPAAAVEPAAPSEEAAVAAQE